MAGFVVQVTLGDEEFRLDRVSVKEMDRVTSLTPYKNKREWFDAITAEEPKALIAAYIIAKARGENGVKVRWDDVDFDDDANARWVDEQGREVEPLLEQNDDGTLKTSRDGMPVPVLRDGAAVWVFADTREEVPPTQQADTPATSDTPLTPGTSGESVSSTPPSEAG